MNEQVTSLVTAIGTFLTALVSSLATLGILMPDQADAVTKSITVGLVALGQVAVAGLTIWRVLKHRETVIQSNNNALVAAALGNDEGAKKVLMAKVAK